MKYIHSVETLEIPDGVKVSIKSRVITVEGHRGQHKRTHN
jgi:large subunit ribosomal protein L9e